jgi:hypothetical protein
MPGGKALLGWSEQAVEDTVRAYACPAPPEGTPPCGAGVGAPCRNDEGRVQFMSHTRRYDVAAGAGLVPPLLAARAEWVVPASFAAWVEAWVEEFKARRAAANGWT